MNARVLHDNQVRRLLLGISEGHQHLRLALEFEKEQAPVLPEAVLAATVRAFVSLKTHPQIEALELRSSEMSQRKKDFAPHQLLEVDRESSEIRSELAALLTQD